MNDEQYQEITNERLAMMDATYKLMGKLRGARAKETDVKWRSFLYDSQTDLNRALETLEWIRKGLEQWKYECDFNKETSNDGV